MKMKRERKKGDPRLDAGRITVTRYPTGVFGISHGGSMFWWFGHGLRNVRAELRKLEHTGLPVTWLENVHDRRYPMDDPRSYVTRPYLPRGRKTRNTPEKACGTPHDGRNTSGTADFRCNACGRIMKRDLGWKLWTPSYCGKTGRNARLYRISAPSPPKQTKKGK